MKQSILKFGETKAIISISKNFNNSAQSLQAARKAPAPACKKWNIMPQIGIDALDSESIAFITHIPNMFSGVENIEISDIAICAIIISIRTVIDDFLDIGRLLFTGHSYPCKKSRFTAHHRENICVFACFGARLLLDEPIQFIKFEYRQGTFHNHFVFFIQL